MNSYITQKEIGVLEKISRLRYMCQETKVTWEQFARAFCLVFSLLYAKSQWYY